MILRSSTQLFRSLSPFHISSFRLMASVTVTPKVSLIDRPVSISVAGLSPRQRVSLKVHTERNGVAMSSCALFEAAPDGSLSLDDSPALSGSYEGVDGMGLLWSIQLSNEGKIAFKYLSGNVSGFDFDVSVHSAEEKNDVSLLCTSSFERRAIDKGVQRIPVKYKDFRGTLYLPAGPGPFPALLDIFGGATGLVEYRAAVFASHGFATLACAYAAYDDLPKALHQMDLEYFERGLDYLRSRSEVDTSNIGAYGTCLGGAIALSVARYVPGIKCVVGGSPFMFAGFGWDWVYKDLRIPHLNMELDNVKANEDGHLMLKYTMPTDVKYYDGSLFDLGGYKGGILIFYSTDDYCFNVPVCLKLLDKILADHHDARWHLYQDSGHIIQPPYIPLFRYYFTTVMQSFLLYGGQPAPHAKAQVDMWKKTLTFFNTRLKNPGYPNTSTASKL